MELIRSWLGENLNAAIAQLVVLCRKGIRINANLADRGFGRKLPGGESVDIHLTAVGTSGWSRERLQLRLQLVRIVRERVEILSLQHNGVRVIGRRCVERVAFGLDIDILLHHFDLERDVERLRATGGNRDGSFGKLRKTLSQHRN